MDRSQWRFNAGDWNRFQKIWWSRALRPRRMGLRF
jgi:hypothetical protein